MSVALLSACGSGSSGGSSNSNKEVSVNSPVTGDSTTELVEKTDQVELTEKDGTQVITDVITTPVVTEKQDTTRRLILLTPQMQTLLSLQAVILLFITV